VKRTEFDIAGQGIANIEGPRQTFASAVPKCTARGP